MLSSLRMLLTFHGESELNSFRLATWLILRNEKWHWLRCFSYQKSKSILKYVLLFFCPIDWQVLDAKPFPEVGNDFRYSVDDVGNFVADNKLDILSKDKVTLAAS